MGIEGDLSQFEDVWRTCKRVVFVPWLLGVVDSMPVHNVRSTVSSFRADNFIFINIKNKENILNYSI